MKAASAIVIAGCAIASAIVLGSYRWHMANTVFADAPLTSEFFRTYDPGPVLSKFGIVRQGDGFNGSSAGWRESTRTRGITAIIALPAGQVAGLTAALRDDIDTKLLAQGRFMGSGEDSGEYSYEYETRSAWGYLILERIEPERSNGGDADTWRVRMRLIERAHK
jgi:hypothetical protein